VGELRHHGWLLRGQQLGSHCASCTYLQSTDEGIANKISFKPPCHGLKQGVRGHSLSVIESADQIFEYPDGT
jgi:hypothetical protein